MCLINIHLRLCYNYSSSKFSLYKPSSGKLSFRTKSFLACIRLFIKSFLTMLCFSRYETVSLKTVLKKLIVFVGKSSNLTIFNRTGLIFQLISFNWNLSDELNRPMALSQNAKLFVSANVFTFRSRKQMLTTSVAYLPMISLTLITSFFCTILWKLWIRFLLHSLIWSYIIFSLLDENAGVSLFRMTLHFGPCIKNKLFDNGFAEKSEYTPRSGKYSKSFVRIL